jgi:hypothetical protein
MMKEIDFLPKWYKTGKRRRVNYRRQYMIIAGVFVTLIAWSFSANVSISIVSAQVKMMHDSLRNNQQIAQGYTDLQKQLTHLQNKGEVLSKLDTGVDISAVLAELSYLVGNNIILTRLNYSGEVFKLKQAESRPSVRLGKNSFNKQTFMPSENVRFKLTLKGTAGNAADVTAFIARLEGSEYLCQVIPGILKNVKDTSAADFEVSCYVANYIIEEI